MLKAQKQLPNLETALIHPLRAPEPLSSSGRCCAEKDVVRLVEAWLPYQFQTRHCVRLLHGGLTGGGHLCCFILTLRVLSC